MQDDQGVTHNGALGVPALKRMGFVRDDSPAGIQHVPRQLLEQVVAGDDDAVGVALPGRPQLLVDFLCNSSVCSPSWCMLDFLAGPSFCSASTQAHPKGPGMLCSKRHMRSNRKKDPLLFTSIIKSRRATNHLSVASRAYCKPYAFIKFSNSYYTAASSVGNCSRTLPVATTAMPSTGGRRPGAHVCSSCMYGKGRARQVRGFYTSRAVQLALSSQRRQQSSRADWMNCCARSMHHHAPPGAPGSSDVVGAAAQQNPQCCLTLESRPPDWVDGHAPVESPVTASVSVQSNFSQ